MNLEIITPEKKIFKGKVNSVVVPGSKGSFAILKNHAPIISTLTKGQVQVVAEDNETIDVEVSGGIIEVKRNSIIILADVI